MFFDRLDIRLWTHIQDIFAKEIQLCLTAVDREGDPIIVSGRPPFFVDLINSKRPDLLKELHHKKLNELGGDDIITYSCFGLQYLLKPVFLYDKLIGAICCGPIGTESYEYNILAQHVGVDGDELTDAAQEIKPIQKEKIDLAQRLLSVLATIVPQLSYQKQSKDKQISELTALSSIGKMVNSTLELKDVLRYIMNFLVEFFNATDCSVFVHGEDGEKKYFLKPGVQQMADVEKIVAKQAEEEKQPIFIQDLAAKFRVEVPEGYHGMISIPLILCDGVIGTINLYGVNSLKDERLHFISVLANQVAVAITNAQRYGEIKELAVVDKLTKVFNRRHFSELLEKELAEEISIDNPVSLVLLDVDNFGNYNNTHGHPKGDELLKDLSVVIQKHVREEDVIGRYGGEEFIILLPKANAQKSLEIAERIKQAVADYPFYGREAQPHGRVTVSAGLVVSRVNVSSKELIKEADEAMYKAKNSGRNKVVQKIILTGNLKTEV